MLLPVELRLRVPWFWKVPVRSKVALFGWLRMLPADSATPLSTVPAVGTITPVPDVDNVPPFTVTPLSETVEPVPALIVPPALATELPLNVSVEPPVASMRPVLVVLPLGFTKRPRDRFESTVPPFTNPASRPAPIEPDPWIVLSALTKVSVPTLP